MGLMRRSLKNKSSVDGTQKNDVNNLVNVELVTV